MTAAGVFATGYALVTRYPLGAVKVLPIPAHLALDGFFDAGILGATIRATLAGLAAMGSTVALLTRTRIEPEAD